MTNGTESTDSKEDEDKWGYSGCDEMIKIGRAGASFTWPHLRRAVESPPRGRRDRGGGETAGEGRGRGRGETAGEGSGRKS